MTSFENSKSHASPAQPSADESNSGNAAKAKWSNSHGGTHAAGLHRTSKSQHAAKNEPADQAGPAHDAGDIAYGGADKLSHEAAKQMAATSRDSKQGGDFGGIKDEAKVEALYLSDPFDLTGPDVRNYLGIDAMKSKDKKA